MQLFTYCSQVRPVRAMRDFDDVTRSGQREKLTIAKRAGIAAR
jgi:hypothetical protein